MNDRPRYLLGKGERLTEAVAINRGGGEKWYPYDWLEQRERLAPRFDRVTNELANLPALVCPEDRTVAAFTIHPTFLAKTYFPDDLLREAGLRAVGSRPVHVRPDKGAPGPSTELFVAGKRSAFALLAKRFRSASAPPPDALALEDVRTVSAIERLRLTDEETETFEVVLHAPADWESVIEGFDAYLASLGAEVDRVRRRYLRDLCFVPIRAEKRQLPAIAMYSFLRVARTMPRLREMRPARDDLEGIRPTFTLTDQPPVDGGIRVAIFDGGLPAKSPLTRWARPKETTGLGPPVPGFLDHGSDVTSALLFGSVQEGVTSAPFVHVDHYRVLDASSHDPNGEYYDVLDRIVEVLGAKHYDFVNLSLGPKIPIEDDEIHPWTAKLDDVMCSGKALLVSAAGNDGEADQAAGLARIQPPADGVNVLSVGSCVQDFDGHWVRATYSCIGPGRSPGIVKPDVVSFGGYEASPFWVVGANGAGKATCGTSFASPNALRLAVGVRAHLGDAVEPLGIRALLLHHASDHGNATTEVGWGILPDSVEAFITCTGSIVHILYQGILEPRQYRRALIPLPHEPLTGYVSLSATLCIATETDPKDPFNYTRAGVVPTFRPHKDKRKPYQDKKTGEMRIPVHATSASFFKRSDELTERELREDAREWETVLRSSQRFRGSSLSEPVFDIHYNPREGGADAVTPTQVPYALVVTVEAEGVEDLYDRIATRYRTQLEPLRPVIDVPLRATP